MKRWGIFLVATLFLISYVSAIGITSGAIENKSGEQTSLANPASVYCKSSGYVLQIRTSGSGQYGICVFPDGNECEEWAFYRGECGKNYTNQIVGGCAGVAPEHRDECCINRGYSSWNDETGKCQNNSIIVPHIETRKINLTAEQIHAIREHKKELKFENRTGITCPEACTCEGKTMKCILANGRELTIFAGNSGNIIVQVKGENMTTNVTLYKSDGKLYGVLKNNETIQVKMLPDQVKEKIKEKIQARLENENVSLNENGTYNYQADKPARLFFIFPVKVMVKAEIDPTTGEIINIKSSKWWSVLAKDETTSPQVPGGCGTLATQEANDLCCQSKGYDLYNSTSSQCEFSSQ
jgi:putative hemolysin